MDQEPMEKEQTTVRISSGQPPLYSYQTQATDVSNEAPPKYNTIIQTFNVNRSENGSVVASKVLVQTLINTLLGKLVILIITSSLGISSLVIGSLYFNKECDEPRLAHYLIGQGIASILLSVLNTCEKKKVIITSDTGVEKEESEPEVKAARSVVWLFALIWFIFGSVWVYTFDPGMDYENCSKLLYLYTFWIITASYILIAIPFAFLIICCPFLCCVLIAS